MSDSRCDTIGTPHQERPPQPVDNSPKLWTPRQGYGIQRIQLTTLSDDDPVSTSTLPLQLHCVSMRSVGSPLLCNFLTKVLSILTSCESIMTMWWTGPPFPWPRPITIFSDHRCYARGAGLGARAKVDITDDYYRRDRLDTFRSLNTSRQYDTTTDNESLQTAKGSSSQCYSQTTTTTA